jgi:hypothetical protein
MAFAFGVATAGHGTADAPDAGMFQLVVPQPSLPTHPGRKRVPPLVYKKPVGAFREMLASVARMKLKAPAWPISACGVGGATGLYVSADDDVEHLAATVPPVNSNRCYPRNSVTMWLRHTEQRALARWVRK